MRLPGGHELTVVVYVDHNLASIFKDAFVVSEPIDAPVAMMKRRNPTLPDTQGPKLNSGDARARITDTVHLASIRFPPLESDT